MSFFSSLTILLALGAIASAQSSSRSPSPSQSTSASATPSCIQPRQSSDPSASAISSVLASAVPNACNINTQKTSTNGLLDTIYYQVDSISFNIAHSIDEVNQQVVPASLCPDTFNSIISGCVNVQSSGYWGGWIEGDGANYSISNFEYPGNGLLSPSSSVSSVLSSTTAGAVSAGGNTGGSNPATSQSSSQSGRVSSSIFSSSNSGLRQTTATGTTDSGINTNSGLSSLPSVSSPRSGSNTNSATSNSASTDSPGSSTASSGTTGSQQSVSGSSSIVSSAASQGGHGSTSAGSSSAGSASAGSVPHGSASSGSVHVGSTSAGSASAGSTLTGPSSAGSSSGGFVSPGSASTGSIRSGSTSAVSGSSTSVGTGAGPSSASSGSDPAGSPATSPAGSMSTGATGPGSTEAGGSSIGSSSAGSGSTGTGNLQPGPTTSASIPVISRSASGIYEDYSLAPGIIATGNPTDLVIGGQTLLPGGKPYSDSSNVISLETGGLVDVDGTTVRLGNSPTEATPTSQSGSLSASSSVSTGSQVSPGSSVGTASGATVTSAPTSGSGSSPSPSTSSIDVSLITSTLTSAPPSFSTESTSNTAWTGNTWITTQQNGQTTIVPVIVGCPNCGGIHGGIILWNLPALPSVSFQFPNFPQLPNFHLPCIKIFGITISGDCSNPPEDDNPDDEDPDTSDSNPSKTATSDSPSATSSPKSTSASTTSSQSSSSSFSSGSCAATATRTASDCSVQCGATGTTQTCSTTCSSPVTGCDATGTTIYSSASASESGCYSLLPSGLGASGVAKRAATTGSADSGCNYACPATFPQIPTTGPLSVSLPSIDPAGYEKRALAGRTFHVLEKRKTAVTITTIKGCSLATPAGQPVTTPAYPGGFEFWTSEVNGVLPASYSTISRYYKTTLSGCIPTITAVPANQLSPVQNSGDNNNENSVDHAYENGWLTSFMESIVNVGGSSLTCSQLNGIFFTSTCNFLAPIFGALASATNPDFVVMSQYLNGDAKGWILGSNYQTPPDLLAQNVVQSSWSWSEAYAYIDAKLGTLGGMLMGCLMVQAPNLIDMIQRTNNRIYANFELIDQSLATDPTIPRYNFGFAQQYKDYMNNFATQWNDVPSYVLKLIDSVGQDLKTARSMPDVVNSEWQPMFEVWANYLAQYKNPNTAAWKYSISLAFDTTNTKRDFQLLKRSSCSLASGSLSSITGSQTATSTPSSVAKAASTTSGVICPNNAVDENPPGCVQPSTITGSASTTSAVVCPNNAVDENPPGCVQPSSSSQPFSCSTGSNVGAATYDPATWCGCNAGTETYPTMTTGTGNAACAYTTLPTKTVNPTPLTVTPSTTTSAAYSCTSAASPSDPGFPCYCSDGLEYCTNNGLCDWTSEPPAEDCCLDCM